MITGAAQPTRNHSALPSSGRIGVQPSGLIEHYGDGIDTGRAQPPAQREPAFPITQTCDRRVRRSLRFSSGGNAAASASLPVLSRVGARRGRRIAPSRCRGAVADGC
jgi:hypothetical protein